MPIFRFRLAPVLRLREQHREAQQLALAAVEEGRLRLIEELQQLEARLTAHARAMAREDGQSFTVAELHLYGEFAQRLVGSIQRQYARLAEAEEKREERRLALLEADKDVKSLEQLRTRLGERYRREAATTAQRQADEVGQHRYLEQQKAAERKRNA